MRGCWRWCPPRCWRWSMHPGRPPSITGGEEHRRLFYPARRSHQRRCSAHPQRARVPQRPRQGCSSMPSSAATTPPLRGHLQNGSSAATRILDLMVELSLQVKLGISSRIPPSSSASDGLNLCHTFGHALEWASADAAATDQPSPGVLPRLGGGVSLGITDRSWAVGARLFAPRLRRRVPNRSGIGSATASTL